ncbi:hypothetical protein AB0H83_43310 [Dactylosporangium sp. NPDC050688]|uniref:hypothetical protein n=1 Tax=Dactylosporangium sp. NPDC050688 TaxID=3157217 RepID=UPI003406FC7F
MSDYDIDWEMEDGLQVDHDGGADLLSSDQQFDEHHDTFDAGGQEGGPATLDGDVSDISGVDGDFHDEQPSFGDVSDESQYIDETDLPEFQFDPGFTDGSYDLIGADRHEADLWSQLMVDMNEDVNPYAAS